MPFDVGAAQQFLTGYLSEQEKQAKQKKLDKLLNDGQHKVTATFDQDGNVRYQLENKEQPMSDYEKAKLAEDKRQADMTMQMGMINKGFLPTSSDRYSPQDLRSLPLDQFNQAISPSGVSVDPSKGLPTNPNVVNLPNMGMWKSPNVSAPVGFYRDPISKKLVRLPTSKDLSPADAIKILADPQKSIQLQEAMPDLYQRITEIANGENTQAESTPTPAPTPSPSPEERVTVIKNGSKFTVPKSQLAEAQKSGYRLAR